MEWHNVCVLVACAVSIVENLLALAILTGTKQLRIKYYGFVCNLALVDLLSSIFIASFKLSLDLIVLEISKACYFVSILTILAVAMNRYLALSRPPARYDELVTPARLAGVCLFLWSLSLLAYLLPPLLASNGVPVVLADLVRPVCIITVWLITVIVYHFVFRKIRRYCPPLALEAPSSPHRSSNEQTTLRVQQTRRLLVTFAFILVTSFMCWIPYSIALLTKYFLKFRHVYFNIAIILYALGPAINPLIYWWRLDGFREGLRAFLFRCICRPEAAAEVTVSENGLAETVTETTM